MKTILVIEDDDDTLQIIGIILSEMGHNVINSLTLKSMDDIKTLKPDLILLDHRLKDGSGDQLCLSLKSDQLTQQIPVIFLSADINVARLAERAGADTYITKPFDLEMLIAVVKNFLEKE
jgi:DNA-binding response OmpR family regulator